MEILKVTESCSGRRLDSFLSENAQNLSRSAAQRLIEEGHVSVNGERALKKRILLAGDEVLFSQPEPRCPLPIPQDIGLDVVFEDGDVIVVNKPCGMVVHPAAGHFEGTLVNALLFHCGGSLSGVGGEARPGIVHRLDKDTSGLIIAAKNDLAHKSLSSQIKDRSLLRGYEAIVRGRLDPPAGKVDRPLGRSEKDRKKMAVSRRPYARAAVTHYETIAVYPGYSHMAFRLETGRTHQIRVHMLSVGHPVAGDPLYGGKPGELGLISQCLHAKRLCFSHPRSGERIELSCPLPEYFTAALSRLEQKNQ